jgi:DNA polymerase
MNIIALDFETYYDKEYSLSKITTEEYVRSELFEAIGVGVQVNDEPTVWFSGDHQQTYDWLHEFDWQNSFLLAHNAVFDASILSWRFDIYPKGILDTLSMARAWHGVDVGGSLAFLAEKYQLGKKGTEVVNALGKRRADFSPDELKAYSGYCINDVNLTRALFDILIQNFPTKELKVIDTTIKMFTEPTLELDLPLLEQHLENVKAKKEQLLEMAAANRDDLMSNDKFAELLKKLGVEPPVKISAKTGKEAWAFAKTDEAFKELANHPDPRVQILVGARLGNKTTLEETRTQRFIDIAKRGCMPVPLKYYAAHTGRWGGDDKVNLQNLPSRGQNANKLKRAIRAPEGFVIIDSDSSQIEARVLAWLAEQNDLVEAFEKGEDVYKIMASAIYGKPVEEISKDERFVGKTTILGAGYGMGAAKFAAQLKVLGTEVEEAECKLWLRYEGLHKVTTDGKTQYEYPTRKGATKTYGGKVIENLCQAIARCVIAEQMTLIAKRYKVVLTVHDAVACIAPKKEAEEAKAYVEQCMRSRPQWCIDLPLNCEAGYGESYGDC